MLDVHKAPALVAVALIATACTAARETVTPTLPGALPAGTVTTTVPSAGCWVRDLEGNAVSPAALPAHADALIGELVRVAVIDDDLYAFDALAEGWETLGKEAAISVPTSAAVTLGSEVYAIDPATQGANAELVAFRSGTRAGLDAGEWRVRALLAPLGELTLAYADRTPAETETPQPAVVAIDPVAAALVWQWVPERYQGVTQFPLVAFSNPARDRALILLLPADDQLPPSYAVLDIRGQELTGWPDPTEAAVPVGAVAQGWFGDRSTVYALAGPGGGTFVSDVGTGESFRVPPPTGLSSPTWVLPLGDDRHLLVAAETSVYLVDVGTGGIRQLTGSCRAQVLPNPGWGR